MARRTTHTTEQLLLFEPPTPLMHRAGAGDSLQRRLRIPLTLLAIGVATAGLVGGSFAAWTAQTNNPGSSLAAGTLTIANSKPAQAVFAATNITPGDTGSDTVTITNDGSIPMTVQLTQDQLTASGIEASLRLRIYDQTRNHCYWPVDRPGACPADGGIDSDGYGPWDASGALDAFTLRATSGAARWPAAESHTFAISWKLATSSPNSDQGKSGSFRLVWNGTQ